MKKAISKVICTLLIILLTNDIVYASQLNYSIKEALIKLVLYILAIVLVLTLAIFTTKLFAKRSQKFIQSKYMKIVDMLNIGTNIKVLMLEINQYIYVIVITNNSTEVVGKMKKDELIKDDNFEDKLNKYSFNYKNLYKIKKALSRNYKLNSEEDKNEDES